MSESNAAKLQAIHKNVIESFREDETISIANVEGYPPDKYRVVYNILSIFKDEDGTIQESRNHEVLITIPFGFPHFPPSCKPLTPIYHPDFDPSAICIGDFWKTSQSFVELILHIGEMISGKIFTTSNAFNQDAVEYYIDNQDSLPFKRGAIPLSGDQQHPSAQDAANPLDSDDFGIDTLDDTDLDDDINYLNIEPNSADQESQKNSGPVEEKRALEHDTPKGASSKYISLPKLDGDQIHSMIKLKQFSRVLHELKTVPDDSQIPDKDAIISKAEKYVAEAKRLYQEGVDFENQELAGQALQCFQKAESIVSDYPGLSSGIKRTIASLERLNGETIEAQPIDNEQHTPSSSSESAPEKKTFLNKFLKKKGAKKTKKSKKKDKTGLTFFEEKTDRPYSIVVLVASICLLICIAFLAQFYWSLGSKIDRAQDLLDLCKHSFNLNQFSDAKSQCDQAMQNINSVYLLQQQKKNSIRKELRSILSSDKMVKGLSGRLSTDKPTLSKAEKQAQDEYKRLLTSADQQIEQSNYKEAVNDYQQSLTIARKLFATEAKQVIELQTKLANANKNLSLQTGRDAMKMKKWDEAIDALTQGRAIIQQEPEAQTEEQILVDNLIAEATFYKLNEQSKKQMQAAKWLEAAKLQKQALAISGGTPRIPEQTIQQLKDDMDKALLYGEIEKGKTAFTQGQLDNALAHYSQALRLIETNRGGLTSLNSKKTHTRLSRIMLNIVIVRDQQAVTKFLEENQFDQASLKLASIIKSIEASGFSQEQEFRTTIIESQKAIVDADFKFLLATLEQYLKDNFKTLFLKHFETASESQLSKPVITFVKKIDDKLLFNLKCIESRGGRPIRLILDYLYDPASKKWSFYGEQL